MFVENRAENFETRMRRLIYGFRERLNASRNSLVICLVNSVAWSSSGLRQKWEKCLYMQSSINTFFFKPCDVCKMLFIYNRILLIFLLNAVSNCTLHAFHVYFPHVLFSPFFVILHYHCIYYVFKYGILRISRHVPLEACNKRFIIIIINAGNGSMPGPYASRGISFTNRYLSNQHWD